MYWIGKKSFGFLRTPYGQTQMNFLANPIIDSKKLSEENKGSQQGGEGKGKAVIFMLSSITEKGVSGQRRLGNMSQGKSSFPQEERSRQRAVGAKALRQKQSRQAHRAADGRPV